MDRGWHRQHTPRAKLKGTLGTKTRRGRGSYGAVQYSQQRKNLRSVGTYLFILKILWLYFSKSEAKIPGCIVLRKRYISRRTRFENNSVCKINHYVIGAKIIA